MKEVLKSFKKYSLADCLLISFKICPKYTLIIAFDHVFAALIPFLTVLATSEFIDTAISIFNAQLPKSAIYTPLICLISIIFYEQLHRVLIFNFAYNFYEMALVKYFKLSIIEKQSRLEYKHIEAIETWEMVSRTANNPEDNISAGMYNIFNAAEIAITIGSLSLYLFSVLWWSGLLILVLSIPFLFLAAKCGKEVYAANIEVNKLRRRQAYYDRVLRDRENVEERSLFNYSAAINHKWREKYEKATIVSLKTEAKNLIRMKGSSLIIISFSLIITGILLILISKALLSIGLFVALSTAAYNLVQLMSWKLAFVVKTLAETREYMRDLTSFMGLSEKTGALETPADLKQELDFIEFESIEFKDICFKYPGTDCYVLENFNLRLVKNTHYAIIGLNGAGKTTIIKLLTGLYDNYTGDIFINGKNLKEYSLPQLKAIFSVVYQDFAKYSISLKDNLALGNPAKLETSAGAAISQDMKSIIDSVDLAAVIKKLPDDINTYLGKINENGVDLSFGEWQKIAIARSLYSPSPVCILDEPAAALDPVSESNLYQMFGALSKTKTTIFITHRMGAAAKADEIIVINKGKVAEKGSHTKLLQLGGIYSGMFEIQRSWYQK